MGNYGLEIGNGIISNNYNNYKLKEIINLNINKPEGKTFNGTFNVSNPLDLFFVVPNGKSFGLWHRTLTSVTLWSNKKCTLKVYIYTLGSGMLDENKYGIIINNEKGEKTFDSRYRYLKLIKQYFDNTSFSKEDKLPVLSNYIYALMPTSIGSSRTEVAMHLAYDDKVEVNIFSYIYGATITDSFVYKLEECLTYRNHFIDDDSGEYPSSEGGSMLFENITGSFLLAAIRI